MRILTLNTHSWMEDDPFEKLEALVSQIVTGDYDLIALQEVNQRIKAPVVTAPSTFIPVAKQVLLREDNFAYHLIQRLQEKGITYYFSWQMAHVGYDIFEEGNALLAKVPFIGEAVVVSKTTDPLDYCTRVVLVGTFPTLKLQVASCHFSWWETNTTGFAFEWQQFQQKVLDHGLPTIVLGDFNNPADQEGYRLIQATSDLVDSYPKSHHDIPEATIMKKIDGWEEATKALRIDYIFVPVTFFVTQYERIFDGRDSPIISDHYGIELVGELKKEQ